MKIAKIKPLVRQSLIENKETRKDDFLLIVETIKALVGTISLDDLAFNHKQLALPSFESITRCRRAIQKEQPELKDTKTAEIRAEEEKIYHEEFKRN